MLTLQNIVVPTRDFEGTVAFYRDLLGLSVAHASATYCFVRAGGVNIAIHPVDGDNPFTPTGHGLYLDVQVDDLEHWKARLKQANVAILKEWTESGTHFLLIADPNGNLLELY